MKFKIVFSGEFTVDADSKEQAMEQYDQATAVYLVNRIDDVEAFEII